ncbi:hypothetical protein BD309DRAFT_945311 [Dichomitus squalens]|uniref:Uncharacterized protein n=1 Tax=Dichomitus squalens TaxID=114155 RepID=A0A4Q9MJQ1_9APHY|nr:uncharacterized protein DICSQDRAFT_84077 [Dichomitus squalens LYAD-421 SS1]EJF63125.1 hypothetical protein DICSQDRAFT_84077 [Dichomitus squalens LYAD-421 SS1]TBU27719.1 hypothetical protein BD311DRAFT_723786 [Dichomitus squalens]TBU50588.1 hypothetical protein BD309DRAFT_945311 [Dichomitus squalens]TBU61221.1 hypothetical protein BD310DRAFT_921004 [Dichomitus squalens]
MHPSLRLANQARQPLIRFLGKRQWPSKPEEQHPHPFAPQELKERFGEFVKKFQTAPAAAASGSGAAKKSSSSAKVFEEFWQAPSRFWKHDLEEWEIDLVQSGGATRH